MKTIINPRRIDADYHQAYLEEKNQHRRITKSEWLEIFPQARNYLEQTLLIHLERLDLQKQIYGNEYDITNLLRIDAHSKQFRDELIDAFIGEDIKETEKEIKRINQYLNIIAGINVPGRITERDIEQAKLHDWENLITPVKRAREGQFMALCPFREEKTASFLVKNNFGYCFGCNWQGDTIKFIMELENITFIQAVKRLK